MLSQAEILKKLRTERGLSQVELAEKTGVSKSVISRIETGERTGTVEALIALANFFNVSVDYLACNPERNELVDQLIETLIAEGVIDLDKPLNDDAIDMILKAVNIKIKKINETKKK